MQVVIGNNSIPLIYSDRLMGLATYVNVSVTEKTWEDLPSDMLGRYIWYRKNSYYQRPYLSMGNSAQKYLDIDSYEWVDHTWEWPEGHNSLDDLWGIYVWHWDDTTIYLSSGLYHQHQLSGNTWYVRTWSNYEGPEYGDRAWKWEDTTYYSSGVHQYGVIGNPGINDWYRSPWAYHSSAASFYGEGLWSDNPKLYCPKWIPQNEQYPYANHHVYYSAGNIQGVLYPSTRDVEVKTWNGLKSFNGEDVWSNLTNIFYSDNNRHYVLDPVSSTWYRINLGLNFYGRDVWTDLHGRWYVNNTHELHFG